MGNVKSLFDIAPDSEIGLALAERVHAKYRPVFETLPERERAAVAFFFLPHRSTKELLEVTRPRGVKWYCPFADQRHFPSGHRYSINVYTGCEHRCEYCYAAGYVTREPDCKNRFRRSSLFHSHGADREGSGGPEIQALRCAQDRATQTCQDAVATLAATRSSPPAEAPTAVEIRGIPPRLAVRDRLKDAQADRGPDEAKK